MLRDFLINNQEEVLRRTEKKSRDIAGLRPSSDQLEEGLPIFLEQFLEILQYDDQNGRDDEAAVAQAAAHHGSELHRLGYTLWHVVHAYGALCQSITELATEKTFPIKSSEFHHLNRCLDVAMSSAVTRFEARKSKQAQHREVEQLGALAHELRNALATINITIDLIRRGAVGFSGNMGNVLNRSLKRMDELISRSLTEVRMRIEPELHPEKLSILQLIDQIALTAAIEARAKQQTLEVRIGADLNIEADQQLIHSALSNLIQNAIKYTRVGGKIQIRGKLHNNIVSVEIEDECGGLTKTPKELFKPFEQGDNKSSNGIGLGLAIVHRAIALSHGTVHVENIPGRGCIFSIVLPAFAKRVASLSRDH